MPARTHVCVSLLSSMQHCFLCLQVKGYRYLEEDNSDESESEEEDYKEDEEHGEEEEEEEVGLGDGDEGGQNAEFQGADSAASWREGAEVHRRRPEDGESTEGDREERKGG